MTKWRIVHDIADLCLCLSQLEQFIQVNEHAKVAKQIVGDAEVLIIVALLVSSLSLFSLFLRICNVI